MIRSRRSIAFIVGAALVLAGCAGSKSRLKTGVTVDGEVVEAEGLAPYNAQDLAGTKRASLTDAQRNAVEKSVGVYISARTRVEKAVAIENNILARVDGYVKKYDILSEKNEDGLYKTRIRALVALKDLEEDLRGLSLLKAPELKRPRLNLYILEKVSGAGTGDDVAVTAARRRLIEQGYVILDGPRIKEADIAVSGSAEAFPFQSEGLGGFVSYRARISLKAARRGTGEVLSSVSLEASGLGGNANLAGRKALEAAAGLAADKIGEEVAEAWSRSRTLMVSVENVVDFNAAEAIRKHLAAQPGVADLILRSYDEKTAQFDIQLDAKTSANEVAAGIAASKVMPLEVLQAAPPMVRLKAR